jgi:hypothetical protein
VSDQHNPPGPTGRFLPGHLGRLRSSLSASGGRLRQSVCSAVSRCAAAALRQALAALLRPADGVRESLAALSSLEDRPRLADPYRLESPPRPDWADPDRLDGWHEPAESRWDRRETSDWRGRRYDGRDEYGQDDEYDEPNDPDRHVLAQERPVRSGWRSLLAAGCQLAAWLLGRLAAPGARLLALGAGLATALAVWLAGAAPATGPLTDSLAAATNALAGLTG